MEALLGGKHVVTVAFLEALAEWARASGAGVGAGRLEPPPREADYASRPAPYLRAAGDLVVPAGPGAGAWGGRAINDVFRGCDVAPDAPARLRTLRGVCVVRRTGGSRGAGAVAAPPCRVAHAPCPPPAPRVLCFASDLRGPHHACRLSPRVGRGRARMCANARRKRILARSLAPSGAPRVASRLPSPRPPQPSLTPSLARRSAGADVIQCRPDPPAAAAAAAGGEGGAKKAAKAKGGGAPAPVASATSAAAAAAAGDSERLSVS